MHRLATGDYRHGRWTIRVVRGIPTSTGWRNTYSVEGCSFDTLRAARAYIERREQELAQQELDRYLEA